MQTKTKTIKDIAGNQVSIGDMVVVAPDGGRSYIEIRKVVKITPKNVGVAPYGTLRNTFFKVGGDDRVKQLESEIEALRATNDSLFDDSQFLEALKAAGVDNWDGYGVAKDIVEEWNED